MSHHEGGDTDIVAEVQHEIMIHIIELDFENDSDNDIGDIILWGVVLKLCEVLEKSCLKYGNDLTEFSIDLCSGAKGL